MLCLNKSTKTISRSKVKNFMQRLERVNMRRNRDAILNIGNKVTDINFDFFANDCCKRKFSVCYKDVYCYLRENVITF